MAADRARNVVLNFKMDGQVQYAQTINQINMVMNTAAKEYRNHVAAMGEDATATEKLAAEKRKLEIQMEGAQKRTGLLRREYEAMAANTNTTADQLNRMHGRLLDAENAEVALQRSMERVNEGLSEQAEEARRSQEALSNLETESKELEGQTGKLNAEYELQKAILGENATESEKLALKMGHLNDSHVAAGEKVRIYEERLEQAKALYGENSSEIAKYETQLLEARTAEQRLANDISSANDALQAQQDEANNARSAMDELGESIRDTGSGMKDAGDAMTDAGARMTAGITAPILGIAKASMDAWGEVDDGLDTIVAKTGATGDALSSLEDSFSNVASTTKFDMQQVGDAIGEVNTQFGLMGEDLDAASIKMLKFADINDADVTNSTIKAKQAMSMFELGAGDLGMALDAVTQTAQNTGQSTDSLMDSVTKAAPQLKTLGLDFAQSVEVMGQFEKAGIDSGAAMNYLTKAQVVYAKDGKDLSTGLAETVDKIKNAKNETEALTIATKAFGTKGASKMIEAIQGGTLNFDEFANAAKDSAGAVEGTFDGMEDPIDSVGIAMNNLKLAGADLFTQLQEMVLPIGLQLIGMLQGAVTWFSGLSDGMKQTIIVVLGIAAALGPLIMWAGLLVSSIGSLITGFGTVISVLSKLGPIFNIVRTAMMALTGPVGIIIAIVVALAIIIYKNWDAIKEYTINAFTAIGEFFASTWEWMKETAVTVFSAIVDFFKEWGATILVVLGGPIAWVVALVVKYWDEIKAFTTTVFNGIKDFIGKVWAGIKIVFSTVITGIFNLVKQGWENLKNNTMTIFNGIKNTITTIWNGIKTTVSTAVEGIQNTVTNTFELVRSKVKALWDGILSAIKTPINLAKDAVKKAIDTIKGLFDFEFKWPKLKMPTFSIEGSMNPTKWLEEGVPKLSVKWNAKGGIFTQPTIFGASGGRLQGAGEAGPEAVLPLNEKTLGEIGKGIAAAMGGNNKQPVIVQLVTPDARILAEMVVDDISSMQYDSGSVAAAMRGVQMG